MSHVTDTNESCHTYEWVKSHTLTRPVTHMNKSFHRYRWITLHIRTSPSIISHVTHMNEPCHTYQWVLSHMWTSHFTHGWSTIHIWMKRQFSTQIESCKKSPIISGSFAKNALISHTWMKQDTRLHTSCHFLVGSKRATNYRALFTSLLDWGVHRTSCKKSPIISGSFAS